MAKRKKNLTEPEAWRLLAKRCGVRVNGVNVCGTSGRGILMSMRASGPLDIVDENEVVAFGLCEAINDWYEAGVISLTTFRKMSKSLRVHNPHNACGYWWPLTDEGWDIRAALCRKLARETAPKRKAQASK